MLSRQTIKYLLRTSSLQQQELKETYGHLPKTRCRREARCCSLLPEMTLVEALPIIQRLLDMPATDRQRLIQTIVAYFFINPVEITSCPFLKGQDCLIYTDRAFGCRAYGLWSHRYYKSLAEQHRHSKSHLRKQWENYGVSLPQKVLDFQMPYCLSVKIDSHASISDAMLLQMSQNIDATSKGFKRWHQTFSGAFFGDLSFFLTAMIFGTKEAVKMKFRLVKDILSTGKRTGLDVVTKELPDPF